MNKTRLQLLSILSLLVLGASLGDHILRSPLLVRHTSANHNLAQSSLAFDKVKNIQETRKNNLFIVAPLPYLKLNAPQFNLFVWLTKPFQSSVASPLKSTSSSTPAVVNKSTLATIPNKAPQTIAPTSTSVTKQNTQASTPLKVTTSTSSVPAKSNSQSSTVNILNSIPAPKNTLTDIINTVPDNALSKLDPKNSVVNIICKSTEGGIVKNISSSGILISNSGLILTNAHVAVHPFLDTYSNDPVTCTVRFGSPASNAQPVSLVYISESWTRRHKGEIQGSFSGDTGENDFAILKTLPLSSSGVAQKAELRSSANTLSFNVNSGNVNNLGTGQQIRLYGYPLSTNNSSLFKKEEALQILSFYDFVPGLHGLIETSISNVGKSGASGGALVDDQKYLVGLIANIVAAGSNGETKVHALTIDYIYSTLKNETGVSLYDLTNSDGSSLKKIFEERYLTQVSANLLINR